MAENYSTNGLLRQLINNGLDGSGNPRGTQSNPTVTQQSQDVYTLASNQAIAAAGTTTPVTGIKRNVYVWDAQFTGAGTLSLQSLGSDGATWRTVATMTSSGALAGEVRVGANASMRLQASAAFTAVSSSLS